MASPRTRRLVVVATLVESILAGMNVDRAVVQMPAWQRTGPLHWAAYSRHADLARRAAILYPGSAFANLILRVAAAISYLGDAHRPPGAAVPLFGAALMAGCGLLTTIKAAPNMLRVPRLGDDAAALQRAMDGFQFWGNVRGLFQVLAFVGNVWSLVALLGPAAGRS